MSARITGYLTWLAESQALDGALADALGILGHAARTARYLPAEIQSLAFSGPAPDAGQLSRTWHAT